MLNEAMNASSCEIMLRLNNDMSANETEFVER